MVLNQTREKGERREGVLFKLTGIARTVATGKAVKGVIRRCKNGDW